VSIVVQYALRCATNLSEVLLCHQKNNNSNMPTFVIKYAVPTHLS